MGNKLEYFIFTGFGLFFKLIGLKLSRKFSRFIAFVFYHLIPIRKDVTLKNIRIAFPDYPESKIKQIAYGCYKSFALTLAEILYMPSMSRERIEHAIDYPNLDFIKSKYEEKNGVILLSAHFGNWEYMAASMGVQLNIPLSVIVKSQRNPFVTKWLNDMRAAWGNKVVPLGISIRQVYKELMDKNIVALVADQRGPEDGIRVKFFGRQTAVYPGPVALALKTNAPILYGISVRQPDNTYKAVFEEISKEDLPEGEEEQIKELSRRHMACLEDYVRRYPEQWLWMHNRWKY